MSEGARGRETDAITVTAERGAQLAVARPALEALARRLVFNPEDARDVVQSAFVDAVAKWSTLRDEARLQAWLRQMVVNRAYSHLRQRRLWSVLSSLMWLDPEEVPSAEASADHRAHQAKLGRALERLPAQQSVAFTLRYLESLSLDEVAEAMGIERGTVRIHVQRAVKKLRASGVLE